MAVGGDIVEVTYNHPTIGQGVVYPKANEDSTFNIGGFETADDDDAIDGSGQIIQQLNRKRGFFKVVAANDMTVKTFETMKSLGASSVPATWTFTVANGRVYQGAGVPVGLNEVNANTSVFDLKVAAGSFTQII